MRKRGNFILSIDNKRLHCKEYIQYKTYKDFEL
jgi:hypothetical protein